MTCSYHPRRPTLGHKVPGKMSGDEMSWYRLIETVLIHPCFPLLCILVSLCFFIAGFFPQFFILFPFFLSLNLIPNLCLPSSLILFALFCGGWGGRGREGGGPCLFFCGPPFSLSLRGQQLLYSPTRHDCREHK